MALEAYCGSLTTRSRRYRRLRTRYEDLWLAAAIRSVQRDWLLSTSDSEWAEPGVKASILAWTKLELAREALELARLRKWLSSDVRQKAEERARERFQTIVSEIGTEVPANLLRGGEAPPESVPAASFVSPAAIYRRLRAAVLAVMQAARARSARALAAGARRLRGVVGIPTAILGEARPLARIRSELARGRRHAPLALAVSVFVALAMLIGLTGLPFETPTSDEGARNPRGSVEAPGDTGVVEVAAAPRRRTLKTLASADGSQIHAGRAAAPLSGGTEPLVVALSAWIPPGVAHDRDCSDFKNQKVAQRWFNRHNPHRDPSGLDSDNDGKACEGNPCPCSHRVRKRDRGASARAEHAPQGTGARPVAAKATPTGTTACCPTETVPGSGLSAPVAAPAPAGPVSQAVGDLNHAATGAGVDPGLAGVDPGLPQGTNDLTSGLNRVVGNAGDTVKSTTGGLLGN